MDRVIFIVIFIVKLHLVHSHTLNEGNVTNAVAVDVSSLANNGNTTELLRFADILSALYPAAVPEAQDPFVTYLRSLVGIADNNTSTSASNATIASPATTPPTYHVINKGALGHDKVNAPKPIQHRSHAFNLDGTTAKPFLSPGKRFNPNHKQPHSSLDLTQNSFDKQTRVKAINSNKFATTGNTQPDMDVLPNHEQTHVLANLKPSTNPFVQNSENPNNVPDYSDVFTMLGLELPQPENNQAELSNFSELSENSGQGQNVQQNPHLAHEYVPFVNTKVFDAQSGVNHPSSGIDLSVVPVADNPFTSFDIPILSEFAHGDHSVHAEHGPNAVPEEFSSSSSIIPKNMEAHISNPHGNHAQNTLVGESAYFVSTPAYQRGGELPLERISSLKETLVNTHEIIGNTHDTEGFHNGERTVVKANENQQPTLPYWLSLLTLHDSGILRGADNAYNTIISQANNGSLVTTQRPVTQSRTTSARSNDHRRMHQFPTGFSLLHSERTRLNKTALHRDHTEHGNGHFGHVNNKPNIIVRSPYKTHHLDATNTAVGTNQHSLHGHSISQEANINTNRQKGNFLGNTKDHQTHISGNGILSNNRNGHAGHSVHQQSVDQSSESLYPQLRNEIKSDLFVGSSEVVREPIANAVAIHAGHGTDNVRGIARTVLFPPAKGNESHLNAAGRSVLFPPSVVTRQSPNTTVTNTSSNVNKQGTVVDDHTSTAKSHATHNKHRGNTVDSHIRYNMHPQSRLALIQEIPTVQTRHSKLAHDVHKGHSVSKARHPVFRTSNSMQHTSLVHKPVHMPMKLHGNVRWQPSPGVFIHNRHPQSFTRNRIISRNDSSTMHPASNVHMNGLKSISQTRHDTHFTDISSKSSSTTPAGVVSSSTTETTVKSVVSSSTTETTVKGVVPRSTTEATETINSNVHINATVQGPSKVSINLSATTTKVPSSSTTHVPSTTVSTPSTSRTTIASLTSTDTASSTPVTTKTSTELEGIASAIHTTQKASKSAPEVSAETTVASQSTPMSRTQTTTTPLPSISTKSAKPETHQENTTVNNHQGNKQIGTAERLQKLREKYFKELAMRYALLKSKQTKASIPDVTLTKTTTKPLIIVQTTAVKRSQNPTKIPTTTPKLITTPTVTTTTTVQTTTKATVLTKADIAPSATPTINDSAISSIQTSVSIKKTLPKILRNSSSDAARAFRNIQLLRMKLLFERMMRQRMQARPENKSGPGKSIPESPNAKPSLVGNDKPKVDGIKTVNRKNERHVAFPKATDAKLVVGKDIDKDVTTRPPLHSTTIILKNIVTKTTPSVTPSTIPTESATSSQINNKVQQKGAMMQRSTAEDSKHILETTENYQAQGESSLSASEMQEKSAIRTNIAKLFHAYDNIQSGTNDNAKPNLNRGPAYKDVSVGGKSAVNSERPNEEIANMTVLGIKHPNVPDKQMSMSFDSKARFSKRTRNFPIIRRRLSSGHGQNAAHLRREMVAQPVTRQRINPIQRDIPSNTYIRQVIVTPMNYAQGQADELFRYGGTQSLPVPINPLLESPVHPIFAQTKTTVRPIIRTVETPLRRLKRPSATNTGHVINESERVMLHGANSDAPVATKLDIKSSGTKTNTNAQRTEITFDSVPIDQSQNINVVTGVPLTILNQGMGHSISNTKGGRESKSVSRQADARGKNIATMKPIVLNKDLPPDSANKNIGKNNIQASSDDKDPVTANKKVQNILYRPILANNNNNNLIDNAIHSNAISNTGTVTQLPNNKNPVKINPTINSEPVSKLIESTVATEITTNTPKVTENVLGSGKVHTQNARKIVFIRKSPSNPGISKTKSPGEVKNILQRIFGPSYVTHLPIDKYSDNVPIITRHSQVSNLHRNKPSIINNPFSFNKDPMESIEDSLEQLEKSLGESIHRLLRRSTIKTDRK